MTGIRRDEILKELKAKGSEFFRLNSPKVK